MKTLAWKWRAINLARRRGWEVRRFNPFATLETYLRFVVFPQMGVNCVLDVGAHVGEYALGLRHAGYDGHIVSFEPVRASFDVLAERAASDPRWSVHNVALGQVDGSTTINVMSSTNFSSLRAPRHTGVEDFAEMGNVVDRAETVEIRRLDGLFDDAVADVSEPQVFLKMDTQGWDLEVLSGAGRVMHAVIGLQSEMSIRPLYDGMPDFRTALTTYEDQGFAISSLFPIGQDQRLRLAEFDCVMVRVESNERPAVAGRDLGSQVVHSASSGAS